MNIVVCLSRDLTVFSNMTYLADGGGFTHASLGLSEDAEYYYSFNFKGLKKEYRTSLKKKPREMQRFIIAVDEAAAERLKQIISEMETQKEKYQYAKLGVSLRLLSLPNENPKEDAYYCSQFVAAVLRESGCVAINKNPADCTPNDLLLELQNSGQIIKVEEESDLPDPGEVTIGKASDQIEKVYDKLPDLVAKSLNPLYEKVMDKLDVAEDAVGESPEKLAKLTSGLLKNGTGKLMEAKEVMNAILPRKREKKQVTEHIVIHPASHEEAVQAAKLEAICFPPGVADTEEDVIRRYETAPELFYVAVDEDNGTVVGMLNGIATDETAFRDAFFTDASLHSENGANAMLLGLEVLPEYRHRGIAAELMRTLLINERVRGRKHAVLTCLDDKVEMYEKLGFEDLGISASSWGGEEWHEMICILNA